MCYSGNNLGFLIAFFRKEIIPKDLLIYFYINEVKNCCEFEKRKCQFNLRKIDIQESLCVTMFYYVFKFHGTPLNNFRFLFAHVLSASFSIDHTRETGARPIHVRIKWAR